jgi:hypothetical protein
MKMQIAHERTFELRNNYRYHLTAPVFFYWATPNGPAEYGDGMTRDVNTAGAFICSVDLPPVGARVQMDVMLPSIMGGELGPHLTGEGVVLRVEQRDEEAPDISASGFAVSVQFYVESSESVLSHLKRSERVM